MKRAIAWFAENHVAANLLMLLMIVGGLAAIPAIQQKSFPDIEIEVIQIGVPYLGAAPEEVEEGVCVRIEEEIQGIDGIERITSSASEGACGVSAELISGYPIDRALTEIKNAVDGISTFPSETEQPTVSHLALRRNAIQLALSGDVGERALKAYGERVRDEISAVIEHSAREIQTLFHIDRVTRILQRVSHLFGHRHEQFVENLEDHRIPGIRVEYGSASSVLTLQ